MVGAIRLARHIPEVHIAVSVLVAQAVAILRAVTPTDRADLGLAAVVRSLGDERIAVSDVTAVVLLTETIRACCRGAAINAARLDCPAYR
jgi:hypothetical protein